MKKLLIATTLVFALSSCFWDKTPDTPTQTGATQSGATQTGVVENTSSTGTVSTGGISAPAAQTSDTSKTPGTTEKVELNSASEQKLVDDFGKDIDDLGKDIDDLLIKLTENDGAKK